MNDRLDIVTGALLDNALTSITVAHTRLKTVIAISKSDKIRNAARLALVEVDSVGNFLASLGTQNNCKSSIKLWENKDCAS